MLLAFFFIFVKKVLFLGKSCGYFIDLSYNYDCCVFYMKPVYSTFFILIGGNNFHSL